MPKAPPFAVKASHGVSAAPTPFENVTDLIEWPGIVCVQGFQVPELFCTPSF